jgi:dTDP-glucose 4,6-dehydratase
MLESFLRANDELGLRAGALVLTRDPRHFAHAAPHVAGHPAIALQGGDVATFDRPEGDCTHVLHMATETALGSSRAASFKLAVQGTERVLGYATDCGARKILLTSSGAVYGPQPADLERIPEDYLGAPGPHEPSTGYGQGKRAAEFLCSVAAMEGGPEAKIARCFAFVGPMLPLDANFAIGNFIRDALAGDGILVSGDGTPRRSYLYAADLAIWLWTILFRGVSGRPYNVGSEEDLGIADLAGLAARVLRPGIQIRIASAPGPGAPTHRYVPSNVRASSELGLRAWISLEDALRRTAEWHS